MNAAIYDQDSARTVLQIPGMYGRDLFDLTFIEIDNIEYLQAGGNILIAEDYITSLPTKSNFTTTIDANGFAKWFTIKEGSGNKKIRVTVPENASYAVYDEYGQCWNFSLISKKKTITLPENGSIVFAGEPGAKFTVSYVD